MSMIRAPQRRVVLSYGIFDLFTPAHAAQLQTLSQMGSELIIGCATDAYCDRLGLIPNMGFAARRAVLESCRYVSRVIAQDDDDQHRTDIVNYNVGLLAVDAAFRGQFDHLQDVAQVCYLTDAKVPFAPVTVDQHKLTVAA